MSKMNLNPVRKGKYLPAKRAKFVKILSQDVKKLI